MAGRFRWGRFAPLALVVAAACDGVLTLQDVPERADGGPDAALDAGGPSGPLDIEPDGNAPCSIPVARATLSNVPGKRLHLLSLVGEDGLKLLAGFYDSKLGARCMPGDTAAGSRCVPTGRSSSEDYAVSDFIVGASGESPNQDASPSELAVLTPSFVTLTTMTQAIVWEGRDDDGVRGFLGELEVRGSHATITAAGRVLPTQRIVECFTSTDGDGGCLPGGGGLACDVFDFGSVKPELITSDASVFVPAPPPSTVYAWSLEGEATVASLFCPSALPPPANAVRLGPEVLACAFDTTTPAVSAGARLSVQTWELGDLVLPPNAQPYELFDAALGQRCSPHKATDGMLRCLPADDWALVTTYGNAFADSSCTVPAALVSRTGTTPYVIVTNVDGASTRYRAYKAGPVTPPGAFWFRGQDGDSCNAAFTSPSPIMMLGPEIPPSTYARLSYLVE